MIAIRITVHLTELERELLAGIDGRCTQAAAQYDHARRDFDVAAIAMTASRGIRAETIVELTSRGVVVECAPPEAE